VHENEVLTAEIEEEPDRLIPLVLYNVNEKPRSKLVYLDGRFELKNVINARVDYGGRSKSIQPIADTGYYVQTSGTSTAFTLFPVSKYDVFGVTEGYITTVTGFSVVFHIDENGTSRIFSPSGDYSYKELNVYDIEGNLYGRIECEYGSFFIMHYRKDRPWVIISRTRRGYGGLGVYDLSYDQKYTFENLYRGWPLYGSASYIVIEGEREYGEPETINVYNGACELIWDYELSDEEYRQVNTRVKISENEKYICISTENRIENASNWKLDFKVLDIATGEEIYGVENAGIYNGYVQSFSNDGLTVLVNQRDYPLDEYTRLLIIKNGKTIGEVSTHPDNGKIEGYMTPDGKYLIAGITTCVKVFKISHN
jgi:hypothetical protein